MFDPPGLITDCFSDRLTFSPAFLALLLLLLLFLFFGFGLSFTSSSLSSPGLLLAMKVSKETLTCFFVSSSPHLLAAPSTRQFDPSAPPVLKIPRSFSLCSSALESTVEVVGLADSNTLAFCLLWYVFGLWEEKDKVSEEASLTSAAKKVRSVDKEENFNNGSGHLCTSRTGGEGHLYMLPEEGRHLLIEQAKQRQEEIQSTMQQKVWMSGIRAQQRSSGRRMPTCWSRQDQQPLR